LAGQRGELEKNKDIRSAALGIAEEILHDSYLVRL